MLTDEEKAAIRRYCGYPAYGSRAEGFQGWRFHQAYGLMEFRMVRMSGAEEGVARQYLATLDELGEQVDLGSATATSFLDDWRLRLCGFMGVPPGPALRNTEAPK